MSSRRTRGGVPIAGETFGWTRLRPGQPAAGGRGGAVLPDDLLGPVGRG